jgi:hypothetical protein
LNRTYGYALAVLLAMAAAPVAYAQDDATVLSPAEQARADALGLEAQINAVYAYPERLPGGRFQLTPTLRSEAEQVGDRRSLLTFAERALTLLADHHAITGASFSDSWAVVPSHADVWIEPVDGEFRITAVRSGSPAAEAGIAPGMSLLAVDSVPIAAAVSAFWSDLGADPQAQDGAFAARVLAAGRRNAERVLLVRDAEGNGREHRLPNLYQIRNDLPPVSTASEGGALVITFNDSLGDSDTVAAFDAAMAAATPGQRIVLDLTNTPSGGNTTIARAVMGWFTARPMPYQMHFLPGEERETGIARQWAEYVQPRAGKHHGGPVEVRVGRWTGSMGEGLALGMSELDACVSGEVMAGLLGAIYDHPVGQSDVIVKLPTERLQSIGGLAREAFVPQASCR